MHYLRHTSLLGQFFGLYTHRLRQSLEHLLLRREIRRFGVEISKDAAAKRVTSVFIYFRRTLFRLACVPHLHGHVFPRGDLFPQDSMPSVIHRSDSLLVVNDVIEHTIA